MSDVRDRVRPGVRTALRVLVGGFFAFLGLLADGCHSDLFTYGTPVMTVSNVPGRFSTYLVYIDAVVLTTSTGGIIEPLVTAQRVDLTKLNDMSELLGAPAGITGTYVSASITIDYTDAQIAVDVNGVPTQATVIDADTKTTATSRTITATFDPAHPLVLTNGSASLLDINFDLTASTVITSSGSTPEVVVDPAITVSTVPVESRPLRLRGAYVTTNATAGNIIVNARPFDNLGQITATLGAVIIQPSAQTVYYINGSVYTGATGLAMISQTQQEFDIAAYGTIGTLASALPDTGGNAPVLNATEIFSGTSLEGVDGDRVTGTIVARGGDSLTLESALVLDRCGYQFWYPKLPLTVSSATTVTEDGSATTSLTQQSVSVGQQVSVYGQADPNCVQTSSAVDATAGQIRMLPTAAWGTVNNGAGASSIALNLGSLGDISASQFDFSGTGSTTANNATAASYVVNTGTANESAVPSGTVVLASGTVAPFAAAPPDFNATSVTLGDATDQQLVLEYSPSTHAPFVSVSSSALVVNADAPFRDLAEVDTGPFTQSLTSPTLTNVTLVPDTTVTDQFAIGNALNGYKEFNTFAGLVSQIGTFLSAGDTLQKLVAVGHFDSATNTFTAYRINLVQGQ